MNTAGNEQVSATPSARPVPAAADAIIPLPPPRPQPPLPPATGTRLVPIVVGLLLLLAFLLASFPARNTDVWRHLAAGKQLLAGNYRLGTDPFASTTNDVTWVNHSWLYDLITYAIYQAAGGPGLVVFKALLIALLAAVLLRLSRSGPDPWPAIFCTTLALIAVAASVPLQPVCVSYLFLALTLLFLERAHQHSSELASGVPLAQQLRPYVPLLVLFVFWANLDEWFLLGPLAVILYSAGEWWQRRLVPVPGKKQPTQTRDIRLLALLSLLAVAVCLLSPHHVFVFQLPAALAILGTEPALAQDRLFAAFAVSPFQASYLNSLTNLNVAALAYYPLVLLSLVSFVLNRAGWRWSRVLVWSAFLLLSAWRVRAVPFFAIVAGPAMALNFQEYFAWRRLTRAAGKPLGEPEPTLLRPALLVVLYLLIVVAAWPGWLQGRPYDVRRWGVEKDISLERVAQRLEELRGGLPADSRTFNVTPDIANVLAWADLENANEPANLEKGFCDGRVQLFPAATLADYSAVRQGLLGLATGTPPDKSVRDWRTVLRQWKVNLVIVTDGEEVGPGSLVTTLLNRSPEWPLLFLEGRTAIFGWADPAAPGQNALFAHLRLDLDGRAFHPSAEKKAPPNWPGRWPRTPAWSDPYLRARPGRSVDREEAAGHLLHFDSLQRVWPERQRGIVNNSLAAALVGRFAGGEPMGTFADSFLRLSDMAEKRPERAGQSSGFDWINNYVRSRAHAQLNDGPPSLLLLAVRAARRAVSADPDDAQAWHLLGEAYYRLSHYTSERTQALRFNRLALLRRAQTSAAFAHALLLQPDQPLTHLYLFSYYRELGYLDLALDHLKSHVKFSQRAGPRPGEPDKMFQERIAKLETDAGGLEENVRRLTEQFEKSTAGLLVVQRARGARLAGLAGKARDLLLAADPVTFGPDDLLFELDLLLQTGRIQEVRDFFKSEAVEHNPALLMRRGEAAAAVGAYAEFDRDLSLMSADFPPAAGGEPTINRRKVMVAGLVQLVLGGATPEWPLSVGVPNWATPAESTAKRKIALTEIITQAEELRTGADMATLRGVLALEAGETPTAQALFAEALECWTSDANAHAGGCFDFAARPVAQFYLRWIEPKTKY
jgi:tetratricopeptide (TPR) repeat protein